VAPRRGFLTWDTEEDVCPKGEYFVRNEVSIPMEAGRGADTTGTI